MPAPTRPFQVGDRVNIVANDIELESISIDNEYADSLREDGPYTVERVSSISYARPRVYMDTRCGRFYLHPEHLELATPAELVIVSRRPPKRIRQATVTPLPLP